MIVSPQAKLRRPSLSRTRRIIYDWWLAFALLALLLGSDYKWRIRPVDAAIDAGIDSGILIEIALYGLVAAFVLYSFPLFPKTRRLPVHVFLAGCFVTLVGLSSSYSPYLTYSVVRAGQFCVVMLLVLAASQHADRAHFHRFAHAYLLLICASVAYGFAKPSPAVNPRQVGRFTWLAIHPTISGVLTGLAVLIAVAYLWRPAKDRPGPHWPRAVYTMIFVIVTTAMLMTQTRAAIGGAALGLVILCVMRLGARRLIDLILTLFVVTGVVGLAGGSIVTTYFERGESTEALTTLNSRTELWAVAWEAFGKNPVFGYGIGSSRGIFYTATGLGGAHNTVVSLLVELGMMGLITWFALIIAIVIGTIRLPRTGQGDAGLDRAIIAAVVAFLLFDGIFYDGAGSVANAASTWLFVTIAWLAVAQRTAGTKPERLGPNS